MQQEIHPWNWYLPAGARTVVIGTFPPTLRNWSYNFFYPNKNNYFWKIMAQIAQQELQFFSGEEAVAERKRILQRLHLGLSDMGKIVRRAEGNSLDENLEAVEYMDVFQLLDENPSIRKILFTSSSGKSSAIQWFKEYLSLRGIPYQIPKGPRPLKNQIDLNGRILEIVILYSTSPRVGATVSFEKLVELFEKEIITNVE